VPSKSASSLLSLFLSLSKEFLSPRRRIKPKISLLSDRLRKSEREREKSCNIPESANVEIWRFYDSGNTIGETPRSTLSPPKNHRCLVSLPLCGCRQVRIKKTRSSVRAVPSHASRGACCHCQYRNHAMITHTRGRDARSTPNRSFSKSPPGGIYQRPLESVPPPPMRSVHDRWWSNHGFTRDFLSLIPIRHEIEVIVERRQSTRDSVRFASTGSNDSIVRSMIESEWQLVMGNCARDLSHWSIVEINFF